jgi:hypothetical protein
LAIGKGSNLDFTYGKGKEKRMPWMESLKKGKKEWTHAMAHLPPFPPEPASKFLPGEGFSGTNPPSFAGSKNRYPSFQNESKNGIGVSVSKSHQS